MYFGFRQIAAFQPQAPSHQHLVSTQFTPQALSCRPWRLILSSYLRITKITPPAVHLTMPILLRFRRLVKLEVKLEAINEKERHAMHNNVPRRQPRKAVGSHSTIDPDKWYHSNEACWEPSHPDISLSFPREIEASCLDLSIRTEWFSDKLGYTPLTENDIDGLPPWCLYVCKYGISERPSFSLCTLEIMVNDEGMCVTQNIQI
ncbi:hypothetical protein CLAIMM_13585 isoform 1 [Cladophialophora immunda]|nr:hypothetical protein CLAIMM_13585 isoform 1 [Cladophialophora immunda]